MTKAELIYEVKKATKLPAEDVKRVINALFAVITKELSRGEKVYTDIGTFLVRERAERDGRNPRTGEPIKIPASKLPAFRPSPSLKAKVNRNGRRGV